MTPRLLRVNEAAEAIGFGRSKTYQLINRGLLRVVRIDGTIRVPAEAVDEFVWSLQAGHR